MVVRTIFVWETSCVISVHQQSESVWIAVGEYMGKLLEVKGPSAEAAVRDWAQAARIRSN
jgi:hypothetical protein